MDGGWAGRMLRHPGGIHSLFPKAGSEIRPCISLRFRSFDTWNEARSLSLRGVGKFATSGWKRGARVAHFGMLSQHFKKEEALVWSWLLVYLKMRSTARLKKRDGTR